MHAAHGLSAAEAELAAETYGNAIVLLRRAYDALLAIGDRVFRSSVTAYLARALYATGEFDEAAAAALEAEELSGKTDLMNFAMGRGVRHASRRTAATESGRRSSPAARSRLRSRPIFRIFGPARCWHSRTSCEPHSATTRRSRPCRRR